MMRSKVSSREAEFRPQARKTLRHALIRFVTREFPRLGGPWIIDLFVDRLLEVVDTYRIARGRLSPGQTIWPAVAVDEVPGYRKPMSATRQVPVIVTLVNQDDIADLRNEDDHTNVLQRAVVRAAHDAYAQGGVLTTTDLALLYSRTQGWIAKLIRRHEAETGDIVPRRGNIHDIGRTVSHKRIICRKAYVEGKPTHLIARETHHSPEAVDHYILDFARVYFATRQCGMTPAETAFAMQRSLSLVTTYIEMIGEFGLDERAVYERTGVELQIRDDHIEPTIGRQEMQNERREQAPGTG